MQMIFTKDNFIKFEILMWKSRNENHFGFFCVRPAWAETW